MTSSVSLNEACMYVCVCRVGVRVCLRVCRCVYVRLCACVLTHVHVHVWVLMCMCVLIHVYVPSSKFDSNLKFQFLHMPACAGSHMLAKNKILE